jgi:superoxide reductase
MSLADIAKTAATEGKEKHVPVIELHKGHGPDGADLVRVIVGKETAHPNTIEHHIAWLELFGVKPDGQVISLGKADFGPSYTAPNVAFQVNVSDFASYLALSYCNVHGVWQGEG